MPTLDVFQLDRAQLPMAWPLVRECLPQLPAHGWDELARGLVDRGGGVLGVSAPDRVLYGVATYEPVELAGLGRILSIDALVTFELSSRAPARHVLMQKLGEISNALGCSGLVLSTHRRPRPRKH